MLEWIIDFDKQLMLSINGCTGGFLDAAMPLVSNKYAGIPIYIAILVYFFYKFPVKYAIFATAAVIITFALCDSLSVALFKETFHRLRPCWDPEIMENVRMLEYKGGKFGFISSHAANLFGIATAASLFIRKWPATVLLFLWAAIVGYSRIYVGKHFPGDVVCGALLGIIMGVAVYFLSHYLLHRFEERNLRRRKKGN